MTWSRYLRSSSERSSRSMSPVIGFPPLTDDTPRGMIQTGDTITQVTVYHNHSSENTDGDSGRFWERRLSFLPNSAGPDRRRDPAQREYTLVSHVFRSSNNWTLLTVSPRGSTGWRAALFPWHEAWRHTSLPRRYQDAHRQLQKSPGGRHTSGWERLSGQMSQQSVID